MSTLLAGIVFCIGTVGNIQVVEIDKTSVFLKDETIACRWGRPQEASKVIVTEEQTDKEKIFQEVQEAVESLPEGMSLNADYVQDWNTGQPEYDGYIYSAVYYVKNGSDRNNFDSIYIRLGYKGKDEIGKTYPASQCDSIEYEFPNGQDFCSIIKAAPGNTIHRN